MAAASPAGKTTTNMLKVHKVGDLADAGSHGEAEVAKDKLGPWPEKKKKS